MFPSVNFELQLNFWPMAMKEANFPALFHVRKFALSGVQQLTQSERASRKQISKPYKCFFVSQKATFRCDLTEKSSKTTRSI